MEEFQPYVLLLLQHRDVSIVDKCFLILVDEVVAKMTKKK